MKSLGNRNGSVISLFDVMNDVLHTQSTVMLCLTCRDDECR